MTYVRRRRDREGYLEFWARTGRAPEALRKYPGCPDHLRPVIDLFWSISRQRSDPHDPIAAERIARHFELAHVRFADLDERARTYALLLAADEEYLEQLALRES